MEYKGFTFKRAETGAITICSDFVISRRSKEKNRLVFNFLRDINTVDTELLLKYKKKENNATKQSQLCKCKARPGFSKGC